MQSLYEWDFRPMGDLQDILKRNIDNYKEDADEEFIGSITHGVIADIKPIDEEIIKAAPEWPLEQVSSIDKTILRIAIYELLSREDVPPKVAINEAVELGKTFGGENSSKFINGVLGTVYRGSKRYDVKDDAKSPSSDVQDKGEEKTNES